jgi:integrase
MADFIEICGDKGVGDYKKSDGREFIQVLRRLPANLEKRRASFGLQGHGLRKVADVAGEQGLLPQDDSNSNKKIGIVDQCFGWIIRQFDECTASPVGGMKLALKRSPREDKDPFTVDQLNAIFAAPVYTGCESERGWSRPGGLVLRHSAKFWVPLIALFSGMRSGEICQLTRAQVRCHEGVHYFALTSHQRLKNPASIRSVPIHHILVRCGFLQFVAERGGLLFPDLVEHASGRRSDAFGKHFARFSISIGIKSDSTDFHSFRHTFVAAAEASGIDFATRERIVGHALPGQAGRYGQTYKQEQADMQLVLLRERQLQRLEYPGLDIGHLFTDTA